VNSPMYRECVVCKVERLAETLNEQSICPFCPSTLPPPEPPKKEYTPHTTNVQPASPIPLSEQNPLPYTRPEHIPHVDSQQELATIELARTGLMDFIQRFRPKYLAGWVHMDICRRLERFMQAVERGESPRLLLMCPPRMGKSEIGSRHFPAWVLGHHPDWEIIAASHTSSLTLSFSRYNRDLLNDPAYHSVFEETKLDPQSKSVENWNLTKGGGYLAAGVGTGITGRGAHILLLDDLVKDIEAADSPTISENTWEWYGSTAYTRLAPGGGVLGIMTWWSESDWAGRIQATMATGEGDMFEIVKYPAINEEGDEYILPDDSIRQFSALSDPPPPNSTLTRAHGTAVHPERYDTEAMLRIKRNLIATGQKRIWQALYQQNPVPDDGLFFTKEMFRLTPSPPQQAHCHIYQAWDFAITESTESDYTVGATLYQDEHDNLYVVDIRRFRSGDSLYIIDAILDYAAEFSATVLGFEDGQIWKTMQAQFDKRCQERKHYPSYEILKPLTDKMVRAHPLRGRMQAGKIWFHHTQPWFTELYNEMTRFPAGKHDDQIDALSWAVRLTLTRGAPRPSTPKHKLKSWKEKLPMMGSLHGAGHMAA
jgi:predicted phage terminase large subunit-like protein